jgi:hypothetical protein
MAGQLVVFGLATASVVASPLATTGSAAAAPITAESLTR